MHADVIAGRQINQTVNTIITNFMNKYVNPPCKVTSRLRRRSLQVMSECEEEVGTRFPFGGSVASDDRELTIDEGVPESSVVPNLQFVPDSNVVIQEGEECVRRVLEEIEASDSRTEEASEGGSFVDIMGSLDKEIGFESEGCTFAEILRRADPLPETVLEGVVGVPDLQLC